MTPPVSQNKHWPFKGLEYTGHTYIQTGRESLSKLYIHVGELSAHFRRVISPTNLTASPVVRQRKNTMS